ncbi:Aste57867_12601 [Aphanomyces stellatus]|uniref:Aste57867_12601 protein n=1 Tax=Aphanomyces stellatus TaxID=120398 RepID=A0A485KWM5_9STRA|nr:hypothetical protein As57867_012555 [Aphanomyces stellatus]VFT89452.1 Aste57867_12601 [Aphanomyces stellatus]
MVGKPPLGLTLGFFHHFVNVHGGRHAFDGLTTEAVCTLFVVPFTQSSQLSMVDHVCSLDDDDDAAYVQDATWFVSHAWSYLFLDVVDALTDFFSDQDVAVWFCLFNNNQHSVLSASPAEYATSFQAALTSIGQVVMVLSPWDNPTTLTRTWCVFEVYVALVTSARFEVAMGARQLAAFLDDMQTSDGAFNRMLASIKSERSQTAVASDRAYLVARMAEAHVSFADMDRIVFDVLQAWMVRTIERELETVTVSLAIQAQWYVVLADMYILQHAMALAADALARAMHIYRVDLDDNPDAPSAKWKCVARAANVMWATGQPSTVWAPMFHDALAHLGPDTHDSLVATFDFGSCYLSQGEYSLALPLLLDCFNVCDRQFGDTSTLTLQAMNAVGLTLSHQNRLADAEPWLARSAERHRAVLGLDHPDTMTAVVNYGLCLARMGQYDRATPLFRATHATERRTLGPDHEFTWRGVSFLARMHAAAGELDVAAGMLAACVAAADRLHHSAEWRAVCVLCVGQLELCRGNLDLALVTLTHAYDTLVCIYGPTQFYALMALSWVFVCLQSTSLAHPPAVLAKWEAALRAASTGLEMTWPALPCHGCWHPIQGAYFTCTACPMHVRRACAACVDRVCDHGRVVMTSFHAPAWYILMATQTNQVIRTPGSEPKARVDKVPPRSRLQRRKRQRFHTPAKKGLGHPNVLQCGG